jgi:hypothetical protein
MMQTEISKRDAPLFLTVLFPLIAKLTNLVSTYLESETPQKIGFHRIKE